MKNHPIDSEKFFKIACGFEGALLVVAVLLGWVTGIDPFASLVFSEKSLMIGLAATLPLLLIFYVMQHLPYEALQKIRALLAETLGVGLSGRHWADLFILAAIAGCSEEVLFRGFLQPWLESYWSAAMALVVSNLIFALVHAVTPLYALLALLMGLYLGVFLDYEGERNLLIPVVIHTMYDFVAFFVIMRAYRNSLMQ